jgi:hypothetical protein
MNLRLAQCLLLPTVLMGCSYRYEVKATERNGKIVFEPEKDRGSGCLSNFEVKDQNGKLVWKIDAGEYLPPPCVDKFPLVYGVVPKGMAEPVHAEPLRAGVRYRIDAWDGDTYFGAFKFRAGIVVENIDQPY